MNYIVLDMEWNQAISYSEMIKEPVFLTGEIIQIGAVKLNDSFEAIDTFNGRVAPRYYTELHPQVAEVTKLCQKDLRCGDPFLDVFDSFCEWCGTDFAFFIWGTEDLRILRKISTPVSCPFALICRTSLLHRFPMIPGNIGSREHSNILMKFLLMPTTHLMMPEAPLFYAIIWI